MSGDKLQGANVLLCATMTSELCASSIVPQTLLAIVEEGEGREPRRLHHSPSATTRAGRLQGSLSPHGPKMVFNTSWGYHSSFWPALGRVGLLVLEPHLRRRLLEGRLQRCKHGSAPSFLQAGGDLRPCWIQSLIRCMGSSHHPHPD
ncbi:uncharacterized protein LOC144294232 isoform X1 [Canis aureus]